MESGKRPGLIYKTKQKITSFLIPIQNILDSIITKIKSYKIQLAAIAIICALYIGFILLYTHGALIYGWDMSGYYSTAQALAAQNPEGLSYALGIFLGLQNFYAGYYITIFIASFLTLLGVYFLAVEVFEGYIEKNYLELVGLTAALLYLFNPGILTYVYVPFTENVSITHAAFILFLIEVIRFYKSGDNSIFKTRDAVLMGIGLGLSLGLFPNGVRYLIVGLGVFAFFAIMKLLLNNPKGIKQYIAFTAKTIFIFGIALLISGIYLVYPLLQNYGSFTSSVGYVSQGALGVLSFYTGFFNTFIQAIRLIGSKAFTKFSIIPYTGLYFSNPLAVFSTFLWLILALAIPIILAGKKSYKVILPVEIIILLSVFWAKGNNAPFGSVYLFITSHIPVGYKLIPPTFLAPILLSELYCILAAFSIVSLCLLIMRSKTSILDTLNRLERQEAAFIVFGILLVLTIIAIGLPIFTGQIEGTFFSNGAKGFVVPNQYQAVKSYLLNNSGSTLLLPSTSTYVQPSWGGEIGSRFYNSFFYPANLITLNSVGGQYGIYIPSILANYTLLTTPLSPGESIPISYVYGRPTIANKGIFSIYAKKIVLYNTSSPKIQINFPLNNPISLAGYKYVTLQFNVSNESQLTGIIENNTLEIAIGYQGNLAFYDIGPECDNCYINLINNNTVDVSMLLNQASNNFIPTAYNLSHVTHFEVEFTNGSAVDNLTLLYPKIYGAKEFSVDPTWLASMKQDNVSYILVDHSITQSSLQSKYYLFTEINFLTYIKYITPVYNGTELNLYRLNYYS